MDAGSGSVRSHRDLEVWQRAVEFAVVVCRMTEDFPKTEIYGLSSQLRRAAVSVASNIAEGSGRRTTKDFLHFLVVARGSLREVDTQIEIAQRLCYGRDHQEIMAQGDRVGQMLSGLIRSLDRRIDA